MSTKHPIPEDMPQRYVDMIGQQLYMSGGLFSRRRSEPETLYTVLAIRWGTAHIFDRKTMHMKHPTFEMLVKNDSMPRSRWTTPFPVTEITLPQTLTP